MKDIEAELNAGQRNSLYLQPQILKIKRNEHIF